MAPVTKATGTSGECLGARDVHSKEDKVFTQRKTKYHGKGKNVMENCVYVVTTMIVVSKRMTKHGKKEKKLIKREEA